MRIARSIQKSDQVEGQWFLYARGTGAEADERIELCIKPIPAPEERRIEARHLGRERKMTMTEEGRQVTQSMDKAQLYHDERALHALQDSRTNVYVTIEDERAADLYSQALGSKVAVGEKVVLDGKVNGIEGTARALKECFFADAPQVAIWISGKAADLRVTAAGEEEGKDES